MVRVDFNPDRIQMQFLKTVYSAVKISSLFGYKWTSKEGNFVRST
jgi:hypothetical protein